MTLAQAGVREISLAKTASGADNAGNRVDFTGTFTRTNGTTGDSIAVSFAVNQTLTKWKPPKGFKVSAEAEKMPGLTGYGRLKDLAAVATTNAALLAQIKKYVAASATADASRLVSGFDALLFAWAGVDKVALDSRGGLVDARRLGFLAAFFNDGFYDVGNVASQGQADLDNFTYERVRNGLLTRFLAGVPLSVWKTTGDGAKAYANRFMPLLMLGLSAEDQFVGSLTSALASALETMPQGDAPARAYLDVMTAALSGAKADLANEAAAYADVVHAAAAAGIGRNAARVSLVFEKTLGVTPRQVGGGALVAGPNGNDLYVWSGGDATIDETARWSGTADKLVLSGVKASQVRFARSGQDVTLVIAPSARGKKDGGSVTLLNLDPFWESGVETVVLADATWTIDDVRVRAPAPKQFAPVVLNLDGDGLHFTPLPQIATQYDVDGSGVKRHVSWVGSGDGLLAVDADGDGVSNAGELSWSDKLGIASLNLTSDKKGKIKKMQLSMA